MPLLGRPGRAINPRAYWKANGKDLSFPALPAGAQSVQTRSFSLNCHNGMINTELCQRPGRARDVRNKMACGRRDGGRRQDSKKEGSEAGREITMQRGEVWGLAAVIHEIRHHGGEQVSAAVPLTPGCSASACWGHVQLLDKFSGGQDR